MKLILDMKVCWHLHLIDFMWELPKVSDLNLTMFQFDYNCSHVDKIERIALVFKFKITNIILNVLRTYCRNLIPYMYLHKHQVEYYEKTVYNPFFSWKKT